MKRVWAQALPDVPFRADATWDEIGIDSIKAFEVVLRLEKALGARLPLELFSLQSTAADLVRTLARGPPRSQVSAVTQAFLVPGLFGDSPVLAKLRQGLEGCVAFHTMALPGVEAPAGTVSDIRRVGALVAAEIQAHQPEGDLRIVGFSTGGMIACEAASQLERSGRRVGALCAIDTPLPSVMENLTPSLMLSFLPLLSSRFARTRTVAAVQMLGGGPRGPKALPRDTESLLFSLYLRLGLLERARRLLIAAGDRRDVAWTGACRKRLLVRFSFRAALAWRPPVCRAPMLLIAGEQLRGLGQVERWLSTYPQVEVVEVRAAHRKLFEPGKLALFKPALLKLLLSESAP